MLEEVGLGELFEVEVAHLDDAEAFEAGGEFADGEGEAGDLELMACVGSGVDANAEAGDGERGAEKAAAGEVVGCWLAAGSGTSTHTP